MKIDKEVALHHGFEGHILELECTDPHIGAYLVWGFPSSLNVTDGPGDRCGRKGNPYYELGCKVQRMPLS